MLIPLPAILRLTTIAILFVIPSASHAQSILKYMSRYDVGGSLLACDLASRKAAMPGEEVDISERLQIGAFGFHAGINVPFTELSERTSVGLNSGFTFASHSTEFGIFSLPLFAQFKFHNDATWKSPSGTNIGLSFGAGMQMFNVFSIDNFEGFTYFTPSIMTEFNLGEKRSFMGIFKLRYTHNFGTYEVGNKDDLTQDYSSFRQGWSIGLIFTPGY